MQQYVVNVKSDFLIYAETSEAAKVMADQLIDQMYTLKSRPVMTTLSVEEYDPYRKIRQYEESRHNITLEPFPTRIDDSVLGDLMTLKEFEEGVKTGTFIDYDGHGYYATKTKCLQIVIKPSQFDSFKAEKAGFTHFLWFNR